MRILLMSGVALALALGATPATAQTSNPIQTIDLPPSVSVSSDPFSRVDDAEAAADALDAPADPDAEVSAATTSVTPALAAGAAAVGDTRAAAAAETVPNAEESAAGRVDAIMETLLGPSEEEQRAVAARLYAEQAERHRMEMQRAETLNREARERVEAENARRLAEYRAEVERINADHAEREQARMADWRARVVACEAGDRSACGR
ncbi:hypothetical protein ACX0GZ_08825 [Sphingomonas aestuarii]